MLYAQCTPQIGPCRIVRYSTPNKCAQSNRYVVVLDGTLGQLESNLEVVGHTVPWLRRTCSPGRFIRMHSLGLAAQPATLAFDRGLRHALSYLIHPKRSDLDPTDLRQFRFLSAVMIVGHRPPFQPSRHRYTWCSSKGNQI